MAPGHFALTGPVLGRLVRAGPVPVQFAPAGSFFGDFARAVQPAHFGRAGRVGAFAWAGEVLGHFLQPVPGHFPQPVPGQYFAQTVPGHPPVRAHHSRPPKLGIA